MNNPFERMWAAIQNRDLHSLSEELRHYSPQPAADDSELRERLRNEQQPPVRPLYEREADAAGEDWYRPL